jgi:hypothetical protein
VGRWRQDDRSADRQQDFYAHAQRSRVHRATLDELVAGVRNAIVTVFGE